MAEELDLRASAMPLAFKCPGSVRRPRLSIAETSEPADLGNATHEALRSVAEGAGVPWDEIPAIAARWGVDPDELRMLVATGAKLWPHVAESFRGAVTEVPLSVEIAPGVTLSGHADLLATFAESARVGDWKSGRKDHDYADQMRAYGALALIDDSSLSEATATILWIREGEIENYTMTRAAAREWVDRVRAEIVEWDGSYHPGPHCSWCKRSHECEAAAASVRRDVAAMVATEGEPALARMTPAEIISLERRAKMVEDYAGRVRKAIKAHVEAHGDLVGPESRLTIAVESRRKLDTAAAWPVLEAAGFADADFAACVDVPISRVEKRIAEKAGRGKGAAAVRALGEQLDAAGAVRVQEVKKLVERRNGG